MSLKTRDATRAITESVKNHVDFWDRVRVRDWVNSTPPRIMACCVAVVASSWVVAVEGERALLQSAEVKRGAVAHDAQDLEHVAASVFEDEDVTGCGVAGGRRGPRRGVRQSRCGRPADRRPRRWCRWCQCSAWRGSQGENQAGDLRGVSGQRHAELKYRGKDTSMTESVTTRRGTKRRDGFGSAWARGRVADEESSSSMMFRQRWNPDLLTWRDLGADSPIRRRVRRVPDGVPADSHPRRVVHLQFRHSRAWRPDRAEPETAVRRRNLFPPDTLPPLPTKQVRRSSFTRRFPTRSGRSRRLRSSTPTRVTGTPSSRRTARPARRGWRTACRY